MDLNFHYGEIGSGTTHVSAPLSSHSLFPAHQALHPLDLTYIDSDASVPRKGTSRKRKSASHVIPLEERSQRRRGCGKHARKNERARGPPSWLREPNTVQLSKEKSETAASSSLTSSPPCIVYRSRDSQATSVTSVPKDDAVAHTTQRELLDSQQGTRFQRSSCPDQSIPPAEGLWHYSFDPLAQAIFEALTFPLGPTPISPGQSTCTSTPAYTASVSRNDYPFPSHDPQTESIINPVYRRQSDTPSSLEAFNVDLYAWHTGSDRRCSLPDNWTEQGYGGSAHCASGNATILSADDSTPHLFWEFDTTLMSAPNISPSHLLELERDAAGQNPRLYPKPNSFIGTSIPPLQHPFYSTFVPYDMSQDATFD